VYDPSMVQPMREEVTRLGVKELRTPQEVDAALAPAKGTALLFINSVCGCAAGNARPALALVAKHAVKPAALYTVFAGQDKEATQQARSFLHGQPPSSPAFALLKDGKVVAMVHRHDIEGRPANAVAATLTAAIDAHCR
jgi:putative YphP/YqiW family bacilliredoxin